ncbi:MAG: hypothetical protein LBF43_00810 [Puniceicoccales bacterium]|nr:hypothetical protein [Puniceicoccales bacterium]
MHVNGGFGKAQSNLIVCSMPQEMDQAFGGLTFQSIDTSGNSSTRPPFHQI